MRVAVSMRASRARYRGARVREARQRAHDLGGGEHADVRVGLQEPARRHRDVGRAHPAGGRGRGRAGGRRAARRAAAVRLARAAAGALSRRNHFFISKSTHVGASLPRRATLGDEHDTSTILHWPNSRKVVTLTDYAVDLIGIFM